jgi:hypothetical protein
VEFSVRHPSPLNTYSYVHEENLGSTRKLVENYLLFTCISNLILAIHTQRVYGLKVLSTMTAKKSSSSPHAAGVLKAGICTPASLQYMVLRVCRNWGILFSLVKARTEISEFLLW